MIPEAQIVVSGVPRLTLKTRYPANNNFAEYHSTGELFCPNSPK